MSQSLFLGLPCRPGFKADGEKEGMIKLVRPSERGTFRMSRTRFSLLCFAFNALWVNALNSRKDGITHFAMQHDDIIPKSCWADVLIDESVRLQADIISAVVPIKDTRGLTTTGVRNRVTGQIRRLTMAEVHKLPPTFGLRDVCNLWGRPASADETLIVNTGLWLCDFTKPWVEPPFFEGFRMVDGIAKNSDGLFQAGCLSEDWLFSEWAGNVGLKVYATTAVPLAHLDDAGKEHRNDQVWGEWTEDKGDSPRV